MPGCSGTTWFCVWSISINYSATSWRSIRIFTPAGCETTAIETLTAVLAQKAFVARYLSNLLQNAVKFSPPGVEPVVKIRAELFPAGIVLLWIEKKWYRHSGEGLGACFPAFSITSIRPNNLRVRVSISLLYAMRWSPWIATSSSIRSRALVAVS